MSKKYAKLLTKYSFLQSHMEIENREIEYYKKKINDFESYIKMLEKSHRELISSNLKIYQILKENVDINNLF